MKYHIQHNIYNPCSQAYLWADALTGWESPQRFDPDTASSTIAAFWTEVSCEANDLSETDQGDLST